MRQVQFTKDALEDYYQWQKTDRGKFDKINRLLRVTRETPTSGIGKPEKLKGNLSGYWSRRINKEHRLVYSFDDNAIKVIACRYHYRF